MPTPITFTLTNAGLNAALDANANGLTISLTQIAIGSGKYTPLATRTALQTELARYPLSGGDIEPNSKTLRFSAVIESATTRQAFEVGLFTSTGVLFAVASITGANPLILITANIAFVAAFGMVVSEIPAGSLTVVTDPNAPLAIALINQHTAAANPHAQYAMKAAFDSHVTQNTTEHTNLTNLISAEATARASADTAHTAAANPHPQYGMKAAFDSHVTQNATEHSNFDSLITVLSQRISDLEQREEVQIGEFIITDDSRNPSVYKGYGDWRLVPDVLLKGLSSGGTVGQFSQVAAGSDQSVRATFFWQRFDPSVIVPLRTISISADSTDVNLLVLFTATYGAPVIGERVHFVIESGVLVTASTTSNYAIVTGNWPHDSDVSMDVFGIVAGRGGNGARSGISDFNATDGGNAIYATYPLTVNNLNVVAGGGGGGGWTIDNGNNHSYAGGGGAPFGLGNYTTYNDYHGLELLQYSEVGGRELGGLTAEYQVATDTWLYTSQVKGGDLGQGGVNGASLSLPPPPTGEVWASFNGGLAGVAITGPVTVTGNPVIGR